MPIQRSFVTPPVPFPVDAYATSVGTALNITVATVVKASPGRLVRIDVTVAGSTVGSVNDVANVAGVGAANKVAVIPNVVGAVQYDWPMMTGLVVTPGTGQTLSISFY